MADEQFCQDIEMFVNTITTNLPATAQYLIKITATAQYLIKITATAQYLIKITRKQEEDETCSQVKQFYQKGWPKQQRVPDSLKGYHSVSAELSVYNDLLMCGSCIVIPPALRQDMLERLHEGH